MKESADLSLSQLRIIRRFIKQAGLPMENETKQRDIVKTLTEEHITVDVTDFIGENGETIQEPFGTITDMPSFVTRLLDRYKSQNSLTWHDSNIPEDEIWVKFGGDHGKGSLKFTMQIGNTKKPNSKKNTFVIGIAHVKDTYENLKICITILKEKLENLEKLEWEGKHIQLFLFGDYEFLTKLYGLSGAQGMYPCLWCLATKSNFNDGRTKLFTERNLATLKRDHRRFKKYGKGNKKIVSRFHNSLHAPMLDIELDRIAPPYLHILLGIVLKHHRLLENAADNIDKQLVDQDEGDTRGVGISLHAYGKNWDKYEKLKHHIDFLDGCILFSDNAQEKAKFEDELEHTHKDLSEIQFEPLTPRTGPVCSMFDSILKANKITPQAYHSRSFVGNHCHKYLTPAVYKALTKSLLTKTQECTKNTKIIDNAFVVREKFNTLNEFFLAIHGNISHSRPINKELIPYIENDIKKYMALYKKIFPKKVIPKQHFLEQHCIQWIERYGFGLAFHGEQGGELIHSSVSKLQRRGCGIRNPETQMKVVMTSQHLQASPYLHECEPLIKKRRQK